MGIGSDVCKAGIKPGDVRVVLSDAVYEAEKAKGRRGFRVAWPCFVQDRPLCPPCPECKPRTKAEALEAEALIVRMEAAAYKGECMDCGAKLTRRGAFMVCPKGCAFSMTGCGSHTKDGSTP